MSLSFLMALSSRPGKALILEGLLDESCIFMAYSLPNANIIAQHVPKLYETALHQQQK